MRYRDLAINAKTCCKSSSYDRLERLHPRPAPWTKGYPYSACSHFTGSAKQSFVSFQRIVRNQSASNRATFARTNVGVYLTVQLSKNGSIYTQQGTRAYRSSRLWSEQADWHVKRYVTARLALTKRSSPKCLVTQCQKNNPGTCGSSTGVMISTPDNEQ